MSFTAEQYRLARQLRGSQSDVADFLRVSKATIHRRETGKIAITHEASLAVMSMPAKKTEEAQRIEQAELFAKHNNIVDDHSKAGVKTLIESAPGKRIRIIKQGKSRRGKSYAR